MFKNIEAGKSYKFTNNVLNYYIQNLEEEDGEVSHRYVIVINSITKKIIYENTLISSESTYLTPLTIENIKYEYAPEAQWTGAIFKDKPATIFGLMGYGFGCPGIYFLEESEPPIRILCDNRH